MIKSQSTMGQQVAQAVMAFRQKTTGHAPKAATVVLSRAAPRCRCSASPRAYLRTLGAEAEPITRDEERACNNLSWDL